VAAALTLSLVAGACHRTSSAGACATASSFELVFATLRPGFTAPAAPDDPLAWEVEKRPFFCTEHVAVVAIGDTQVGPDLLITPTEEGRRAMLEATKTHVGQFVMMRIEGKNRVASLLETPMDIKSVLVVAMPGPLASDAAGIRARLRADIARRATP
jgi:hypothetical protein